MADRLLGEMTLKELQDFFVPRDNAHGSFEPRKVTTYGEKLGKLASARGGGDYVTQEDVRQLYTTNTYTPEQLADISRLPAPVMAEPMARLATYSEWEKNAARGAKWYTEAESGEVVRYKEYVFLKGYPHKEIESGKTPGQILDDLHVAYALKHDVSLEKAEVMVDRENKFLLYLEEVSKGKDPWQVDFAKIDRSLETKLSELLRGNPQSQAINPLVNPGKWYGHKVG